jgi:hypothetical protein
VKKWGGDWGIELYGYASKCPTLPSKCFMFFFTLAAIQEYRGKWRGRGV